MTTPRKSTPPRVSRAQAARRRAELLAEAEAKAAKPMSDRAAAILDGYRMTGVAPEAMVPIQAFIAAVLTASAITGVESTRKLCNHLGNLAVYAIDRGRPLDPASLLTTEFIDEYIRLGMRDSTDSNRVERRRRLLWLASDVNPGPTTPTKLSPIAHISVKPCYSPQELSAIIRACPAQPTPSRSRDLSTVVGLGAGAGADSIDLRYLLVGNVDDLGDLGLRVRFVRPRPRIVPVRRDLEAVVRAAVADRDPGELLLGKKIDRTNTAARAIAAAALYRIPHIEQSRLRTTWLADLMTDSIPIGVILQAAGLNSARTLSELRPHLGPWLEHKGLTTIGTEILRGGAS